MIFEELDKIQAPVENVIPSSHSRAGGTRQPSAVHLLTGNERSQAQAAGPWKESNAHGLWDSTRPLPPQFYNNFQKQR